MTSDAIELIFDFNDFPNQVGRDFKGAWFSVDADHLRQFDDATYSSQNQYKFDLSMYPTNLVEGFHLLGLLDHLQNPLLRLADGQLTGWNYGLDRVRFTHPVKAGDLIRLVGRVAEVQPRGDGYLVRLDCTLAISDCAKPAMVAEWWVLLYDGASKPGSQ